VTPDANGQYNVILGSTTATGLPDDLFLQQEQRWLGVQVQGEAELARVLLVSVPYAFKAHEAETLGGLPASAFVKAPPSDGSGSTGTGAGTAVNAVANASGNPSGKGKAGKDTILGPCIVTPGYITYWDSTGALCASKLFQNLSTGNIGIGLTNPSEPLDVFGVISTYKWYGINENRIVGVHTGTTQAPPFPNTNNLFLGWLAGGNTVAVPNNGAFNTFTGFSAGFNNAPGSGRGANTYNGTYAGFANVTGTNNVMVGNSAGFANTGSFNTCIGSSACDQHATGNGSTYVGNAAGVTDLHGTLNSFFGDASGANNVGNFNTFLGDRAGFNNHGSNNTFSGFSAGFNNGGTGTADNNVFYGYKAGFSNTIGIRNTYLGYQAGFNGTTGGFDGHTQGNTFVGWEAGFANVSGAANTFVGNGAGLNSTGGSNTFVGNGAGTGIPGSSGTFNSFQGYYSGNANFTGNNNAFYGACSGFNCPSSSGNTAGSQNTYLGVGAGSNPNPPGGNNNIFVGYNAGISEVNVNNNIEIGNTGPSPLGSLGNTILIGTRVSHFKVFFDPILNHPTSLHQVVTIDNNGQLGFNTIPIGGGVMGSCLDPLAGGTYLTGWVGPGLSTTVGCSFLFQQSGTNFIGIGTTNPSKELDVNGVINARKWYDIGLPETPVLSIGLGPLGSFGDGNLFVGAQAGNNNPIPSGQDTFVGYQSGFTATSATAYSTFVGYQAGYGNTLGMPNTGTLNTYIGWQAGIANTTGGVNVFSGAFAGSGNTTGGGNTYTGYAAGVFDATGQGNTFTGWFSGVNHTSGYSNSFYGEESGRFSTCVGANCASYNSFFGASSGFNNTTGSNNTFLGIGAGGSNITGSNDIYIGHPGVGNVSNTIRVGQDATLGGTITDTYVAGIYHAPFNPSNFYEAVCVDKDGKLISFAPFADCNRSSRRFKEQIADMGDSSSKLFQLRPVTFFYKPQYDDGSHALQYGLIAEEVAKIYPEMAAYEKDGTPYTVKYQLLAPLLLNELQKQHKVVAAQQDELQTQLQQIKAQRHEIDGLKLQLQQQNASLQERLTKLESYVATQMKTASDNPPRTTPDANGGLQ
jgi:hypothetical protein